MPDRDWWSALWPDPEAVLRSTGISIGDKVIDLCSGDGWFTAPMGHVVGLEGDVQAVELLPQMIEAARREVRAASAPSIRFIQGDAMKLATLVESPVDCVFMANTFHGVPDHTALGRAVCDVLRPGGRFVILNWWPCSREETQVLGKARGPRESMRYSPDQLSAWLEPAGFALVEVVEVGPFHYGAVFECRT
ncbi:MAG: class I SAM-dependent methyltransferase [Oligoflexia bacterium]|nr:class I SAM-dependent methyltransferase [Oligoflexia bacterium]